MTENVTNELLLQVLKKMQDDLSHLRRRDEFHDQQFQTLHEQIHALHGEVLRIDRHTTERLARIERRLELEDA